VHAAGLRGTRAAGVVRAVQFHVVGHVLVERQRERAPVQRPGEEELWGARTAEGDATLARALSLPADPEKVFDASVRALVSGLLRT
jgi:hypothetical protein